MAKNKSKNPYIEHRRVYSDVIEQAVATGKNWRMLTIILLFALLGSVAANVYQSTLTRIKPVVIEVDGYGVPAKLYAVDRTATKRSDLVAKSALARVVRAYRGVSTDADVMKLELSELLYFFNGTSLAYKKIASYIRGAETNPFKRAQNEVVNISIQNISKITSASWQIDWLETVTDRQGQITAKKELRAIAKTSFTENISAKMSLVNPLGIMIDEFNITEIVN